MVLFSKGKCLVLNESRKKLISGARTLDNCYGLVPDADIVCNSIRLPNEDLWHQRMGHASYKHLSIISKHKSVLGIPKLSKVNNVVCGSCQLGSILLNLFIMILKTVLYTKLHKLIYLKKFTFVAPSIFVMRDCCSILLFMNPPFPSNMWMVKFRRVFLSR